MGLGFTRDSMRPPCKQSAVTHSCNHGLSTLSPGRSLPFSCGSSFSCVSFILCFISSPGITVRPFPPSPLHSTIKGTHQAVIFFLIFNQSVSRENRTRSSFQPLLLCQHSDFMDESFVYICLKPRGGMEATPQTNIYLKRRFWTGGS